MAKVPMGKTLLQNVIKQVDAHNKIQEVSEMWKLRDMERRGSATQNTSHRFMTRNNMHCDRYLKESDRSARSQLGARGCLSERDEQDDRYWSRKLYEFEASDPDRWGHSGYKELYPEEFQSDGETTKHRKNGKEKKKSKKSSKSKKKKKKKKQRAEGSASLSDSNSKRKPKSKSEKSKQRKKKEHRRKADEDNSSAEDGESDGVREKRHRKRHRTCTPTEPERKKRKNWKAETEVNSEDSSED